MRNFILDLEKEFGLKGGQLTCLLTDRPNDADTPWQRPAVIVVPGGGYSNTSKREAEPVALEFLSRGYQAFYLHYKTGIAKEVAYPEQLLELSYTVDYVKKNAEKFNVNAKEIFVVGFSAGGHLVGNLAVEYDKVSEKAGKTLDAKPTAVGLIYPVISSIHGHMGSYNNLLHSYSDEEKAELLKTLNLNEAVTENTPPAFLCATATDITVPADNALRYAYACANNGVDYELHIYPEGKHGLSTATKEINADAPKEVLTRMRRWLDDCDLFFRRYVEEEY